MEFFGGKDLPGAGSRARFPVGRGKIDIAAQSSEAGWGVNALANCDSDDLNGWWRE